VFYLLFLPFPLFSYYSAPLCTQGLKGMSTFSDGDTTLETTCSSHGNDPT
jgi:hypothetical protein